MDKLLERYTDVLGASKHLKIHPDTVRRLIKENKIPAFKFGNKWLIDKKDLERFAQTYNRQIKRDLPSNVAA